MTGGFGERDERWIGDGLVLYGGGCLVASGI